MLSETLLVEPVLTFLERTESTGEILQFDHFSKIKLRLDFGPWSKSTWMTLSPVSFAKDLDVTKRLSNKKFSA